MSKAALKTRFCPSPTGLVHLGNMRTALFNALLAKRARGTFLLRIEDTDRLRSQDLYRKAVQEDLRWLGLEWDEGPLVGGENGPYFQSQREDIYQKYYHQLEKLSLAYPCFCSEEELALSRKVQRAAGKPPRYDGSCRRLDKKERQDKLANGHPATLRFAIPEDQQVSFVDIVRGEQSFDSNDLGDFIIRRTDGSPPFMYCNAIDDAMMGVTHVLRGEDHLANTPRQLLILRALKLPQPTYGHISLIVAGDGSPLSKRHGSRSIEELRAEGYLPAAINNYVARLGHHYSDESLMSLAQLATQFSLDALGSASAKFDPNQLLRWQKEVVAALADEPLWRWMGSAVHDLVPNTKIAAFLQAVRPNVVFPADAVHWANILFTAELTFDGTNQAVLTAAGSDFFQAALDGLNQHGAQFSLVATSVKTALKVGGKDLYMPLRAALTGETHGPEMAHLFMLIDIDEIRARFRRALQKCGDKSPATHD